jgi:lipopolysaccharide/colanic/teichoic acid biosynthesis glycosyltransferase
MIRPGSKERALRVAVLVAGDASIAWGALVAVVELRRHVAFAFTESLLPRDKFTLGPANVTLFIVSLIAALALSGFYHRRVTPRARPSFVMAIVIQAALTAVGVAALARPLPRTVLFFVPLVELIALPAWRRLLSFLAPIRPRETILLGDPRDVTDAIAGLRLDGDARIRVIQRDPPSLDDLAGRSAQETLRDVEEVILVSPDADPRLRLALLRIRGARGFMMLASHVDALLAARTRGWIGDQPLVEVAAGCGYGLRAAVKRAIDVAGAAVLMIAGAPLWIIAAVAIRLDDGGPVLVRQKRVGLGGDAYGMWKFRSMRGPADSNVHDGGSGRVTRAGAFLRRYHLDEVPQLLNVLTGEMSLVGPRPERPELVANILRDLPDFDLRSLVRPGIAGLAQVSSEYDTRPEVKLRYDLMYMCDWSVWLDFQLMFRAVSSSLAGTGR